MKITFALIPERGHVNPYIGPAQALMDRGHEVVVAAPGDIGEQMSRAGLPFHSGLIPRESGHRPTRGAELVELIQDARRLDEWVEQLLLTAIPEQVAVIGEWLRWQEADAVVIDPLYYPAAIAAHRAGIPWASVSNSLNPVLGAEMESALLTTVRRLSPRRAAIFADYGMAPSFAGCDVLSPYLNVAFTTRELVGEPPEGVTLAGPSFPLRARGDEVEFRMPAGDGPLIYASFGSQIYFWPRVFEKVAAAAKSLGAQLVLAIGDLFDDPRWAALGAGCEVYRYAPQLEVLRHASAFLTHGGANSVMEGLAAGVPLLISPMCNDQFHQAWYVERAGVGTVLNLVEAPVEAIAAHMSRLVHDGAIRQRVDAVRDSYQVDGAGNTARLIERMGAA